LDADHNEIIRTKERMPDLGAEETSWLIP